MRTDVVDLRDFYRSDLGQIAQRMIRRRIREMWPNVRGERLLGLGYATPVLRPFLGEAERVIAVMPADQGVVSWPRDAPNLATLAEDTALPLPDRSIDRAILIHSVETSEALRPAMRELWRVMSDGGRILVVVPNRRGIWARLERTPFGHGRPYSTGQISRLLGECLFEPTRTAGVLYIPPLPWRFAQALAPAWERVGRRWFAALSGCVVVEASKSFTALSPVPARARRRRLRAAAPAMQAAERQSRERPGAVAAKVPPDQPTVGPVRGPTRG